MKTNVDDDEMVSRSMLNRSLLGESEVQASNVNAFGRSHFPHILPRSFLTKGLGSDNKFQVLVKKKERLLRKSVIAYLGAASEFTGVFYPLFSFVGSVDR